MKKNIIIALLSVLSAVLWLSKEHWMERCKAAETVIQRVEEDDPIYVMDVLCEGNEWYEWTLLGGDN